MDNSLTIGFRSHVRAANGGLFISRGVGGHPDRAIDSFVLLFVRSGVLHIAEEDREFAMEAGESLVLWPKRRHRGTRAYAHDLSFFWLHFHVTGEASDGDRSVSMTQHARPQRPDHLAELFRRFLADQEEGLLTQTRADLLVLMMLEEIGAERAPAGASNPVGAVAAQVDAHIMTHFAGPMTPSMVAASIGYDADYVNRLYRKAYGRTISDAIHRERVKHARKLLLNTDLPCAQIGRACGFTDSAYFRRVFRNAEGMTPNAYRRMHLLMHINTD